MHLFDLPYDIRHQIYQHLFPSTDSIYIQAFTNGMKIIQDSHDRTMPFNFLLTCRALHAEASAHLYNNYLYNIVGRKRNCLNVYADFLNTAKKYARDEVHVSAFSNGPHSDTMGISIHVGEAKTAMLRKRARGEPKELCELQQEVAMADAKTRAVFRRRVALRALEVGLAVVAILLAWAISFQSRTRGMGSL